MRDRIAYKIATLMDNLISSTIRVMLERLTFLPTKQSKTMEQKERQFQLALSKLLNRVRVQNTWNEAAFTNNAESSGVSKSEASRFYKALVDMGLLRFDKQRKAMIANFNVAIWQNEDTKLGLIRDIMAMFPLKQQRGRVKGKVYPVKAKAEATKSAEVNPLSQFSAVDLVAELRRRNYEVTARKQVITVEEL